MPLLIEMKNIAIIGGGAAGFFCAIWLKKFMPDSSVTIYEAGAKPLAKVAVTGGGRCNLTNSFKNISNLKTAYPRGEQAIKRAFNLFSPRDTFDFFEKELGIKLVTQADECVFPASQRAMDIVNTLIDTAVQKGVAIKTKHRVSKISRCETKVSADSISLADSPFTLSFTEASSAKADCVVVTTGGTQKEKYLDFLQDFDLEIVTPTPSLFSFNLEDSRSLSELQGIVVDNVTLSLPGTKFKATDTLLITHWGISGPATLKLSSYASRCLAECNYYASLNIRWMEQEQIDSFIKLNQTNSHSKQLQNTHPQQIPSRLWKYILEKVGIRKEQTWGEIKKKGLEKLTQTLLTDSYTISSQGEYKEEFVTCGGVALSNVNLNTLESKEYPGLYFAGEVLDIDAITGGFNLQAAWSTGYVVAVGIASKR